GGTDRAARVWDVRTKELMTVFPKRDPKAPRDDSQQVWAAAFSPDGSKVLTGTWGGQLVSYDARTAEVLAQAQAHANVVRAVAFSADGKTAYSCGEDGSGRRWEVATLSELPTPLFAPGTLVGLAVTADGRRVVTAGGDGVLRLWEWETGTQLYAFRGHRDLAH